MKLFLTQPYPEIRTGLSAFFSLRGLTESADGVPVTVKTREEAGLTVKRLDGEITVTVSQPSEVFRALTLIQAREALSTYEITENRAFDMLCAMLDGSQASSLPSEETCKQMLLYLAGMGYNALMLYCEDCFELKSEPYWGNMRPRYTQAELKRLDDFAHALGIEMIPCIQTLAHLTDAIKKPAIAPLADTKSVLMVDNDAVYDLIERIITEMSSCFRSRRIHVGMDEAWDLGLGQYLKKNGYCPAGELMARHLVRVKEILDRHDLAPMMWADMFFRARSKKGIYRDLDVEFLPEDRNRVPKGMELVYWDYYLTDTKDYLRGLNACRYLTDKVIFAGCARNVRTFASHYQKSYITTTAALAACRQAGIRQVIATVWGDDHRESSTYAVLPSLLLFAELTYHEAPSHEALRERLVEVTGIAASVFDHVEALDAHPDYNGKNEENLSLTRAIIWQDLLLGLLDRDLCGCHFRTHYEALVPLLDEDAKRFPVLAPQLIFWREVARVCALKADLGKALYQAYHAKDRAALATLTETDLPALLAAMKSLRLAHRDYFFAEYEPIGWEILDIRYGGAIARIDTASARLQDYLAGRIDRLAELEEPRLSFSGKDMLKPTIHYDQICSASRL